ncbi:hypothetical protein CEUSTIGMA_g4161.t1 [Chlamydomonas eustigma]|uniref:Uncharacterized protein n=1 Tax=Chlamydomonas eustigma TaxID=1157962 RepID=A0A250X0Y4_9CHLO|nr:hypothetical protein CEUSTIGMA_g4161.t1 [Chlamydomonas eustigma]|eukprot:GAX76715.1 hypothetical protein CEUSTIGMA_g4161.t1 [Chlamydomonas eustigma]
MRVQFRRSQLTSIDAQSYENASVTSSVGTNTTNITGDSTIVSSEGPDSSNVTSTKASPQNISNNCWTSPSVVSIYNGGLQSHWKSSESYGCIDCNWTDTVRKRAASNASIYAYVSPWAAVILDTGVPFTISNQTVLDFWISGPGILQIEIMLYDTISLRYSRSFQFSNRSSLIGPESPFNVLSADSQGWIHAQLRLYPLTRGSGGCSSADNGEGLSGTWDTLNFQDVSGAPFQIGLDALQILSAAHGAVSDTPASPPTQVTSQEEIGTAPLLFNLTAQAFPSIPGLPLVPVFNANVPTTAPNQLRFIMRLSPSATLTSLTSICQELDGLVLGTPQFSGACEPIQVRE